MHPQLSPRQLEAFLAVVDNGTMTRAAQMLDISQPAVSRLISDLTDALGFALFDRRDGRLVPTQEARLLLPDVKRSLALLDRISETGRNITQRTAGHLRITCLPGFAVSHLPGVIARFLQERPGVSVTLEPDRPERVLEWMVGEQFDLGITDGFGGHPAVESERIDIRTVCIFPSGSPLGSKSVLRPRDIAAEKLIHTLRESAFYQALHDAFQADGVSIRTYIEARQFTTACELVRHGLGVAVISELDAAQYQGHGIDYRPFRPAIAHRLSLVRPIHKQPSMITLEFIEAFSESLRAYAMAQG